MSEDTGTVRRDKNNSTEMDTGDSLLFTPERSNRLSSGTQGTKAKERSPFSFFFPQKINKSKTTTAGTERWSDICTKGQPQEVDVSKNKRNGRQSVSG